MNRRSNHPASAAPSADAPARTASVAGRRSAMVGAAVLVVLGLVAYANSLDGPFIFDDHNSIADNEYIRQLWPPWRSMSAPPQATVAGRPVVGFTLAINYALGGLAVRGYHVVNLAIHLLAGLLLFGICRRTLLSDRLRDRFGADAGFCAWAAAALWLLHPIQTESITYVIQRAESLMGLFYLLTLYASIRAMTAPRPGMWTAAAIVACGLGMGSKEVMVTAPVLVLLYDRAFRSGSVSAAWHRRWKLYLGLAATWLILMGLMIGGPRSETTGGGAGQATVWEYARSQFGVVVDYLWLAIWPRGLCLDANRPVAQTAFEIIPPLVVIAVTGGATLWGLVRNRAWAYGGAWFFGILAPTSSIVPIKDLFFEHRMYLPLAGLTALLVTGGYELLRRIAHRGRPPATAKDPLRQDDGRGARQPAKAHRRGKAAKPGRNRRADGEGVRSDPTDAPAWIASGAPAMPLTGGTRWLGSALAIGLLIPLGAATLDRNADYAGVEKIWRNVLEHSPDNWRAKFNLGRDLLMQSDRLGRETSDDAMKEIAQAKSAEAIGFFRQVLQAVPEHADAHCNLGKALQSRGDLGQAMHHYRLALDADTDHRQAHYNLGVALWAQGDRARATEHYREAVRIDPDFAEARGDLGKALYLEGKLDEAMEQYRRALAIRPAFPEVHYNIGLALEAGGMLDEAIDHYLDSVSLDPTSAPTHDALGLALQKSGRYSQALDRFREAIRLKPDWPAPLASAAWLLATHPDPNVRDGGQALAYAEHAVEMSDRPSPEALDALAAAYAAGGEFDRAGATADRALAAARAAKKTGLAEEVGKRLELYRQGKPYHLPLGE